MPCSSAGIILMAEVVVGVGAGKAVSSFYHRNANSIFKAGG
jgi:hypothetical protein